MKLVSRITLSLSIALVAILSVWAIVFYFEMMKEVNDETDDALENHSELLINQFLTKKNFSVMDQDNYAFSFDTIPNMNVQSRYFDTMMYIASAADVEPARVYQTAFKDAHQQSIQLTIAAPTIEKADLKEAILFWSVTLLLLLLVVILIVNYLVYRHHLKPFYGTLKWLSNYRVGQSHSLLTKDTSVQEFDMLNREIEKHIDRTESTFQNQRDFISHAAHELQTPIAICQNRLEMLVDGDNLTEQQMEELMKVQHTLSYMRKLNKSLLFLSRIQNHQFAETKQISLNQTLRSLLPDYQEIYEYLHLNIEIEERGDFVVSLHDTLATSLISNLLKNAFTHNCPEGKIIIVMDKQQFSIQNSAVDATPLNGDDIFNRYFHNPNKEDSTGLGLSIVKAICDEYSLTISYAFENQMHTFIISK